MHAHRTDLADTGRARTEPRRLQVDHDERRALEEEVGAGRIRQADGVPAPGQAGVLPDDFLEEAAGKTDGRLPEREQPPRGLLGEDRAAPLLDELHEPVGGIEPELHGESVSERTFACKRGKYPISVEVNFERAADPTAATPRLPATLEAGRHARIPIQCSSGCGARSFGGDRAPRSRS